MRKSKSTTGIRTAIYKRSATSDAASLAAQEQNCRAVAAAHSPAWEISDELVFTDVGTSGNTLHNRPGLDALMQMAAARPQPFTNVIVDDFSRLGRRLDTVSEIVDVLESHDIGVYVGSEKLDAKDLLLEGS